MQNVGAEFFAWQMSRYFNVRQLIDFDVSLVVQTLSLMENDAC